jgi:restriction endonuclease Mrr
MPDRDVAMIKDLIYYQYAQIKMRTALHAPDVLINGEELAQLMIDHDSGVPPAMKYEVKRCDNDYYGEE